MIAVALVLIYLPSFLDGSQKTARGRQWDAFRMNKIWNLSANFLGYD